MSIAKTFKNIVSKTILKKVYHNDKFAASITRRYSNNSPTPLLVYHLASEQDTQRIVDFLLKNLIPTSPLFDSLGEILVKLLMIHTIQAPTQKNFSTYLSQ
jgi:hypothetical protein